MPLHIVILAAGQGKRMYSDIPKVLHPIAGKPMLGHIIEKAQQLNPDAIHLIIGHHASQIKNAFSNNNINWIEQTEQLGTGHAVKQALPFLEKDADVLILSGDVPLITLDTLKNLLNQQQQHQGLTLLLATLEDPSGLGRIIRDETQHICAIIEEKDASPSQKSIKEINSGIYAVNASHLEKWLPKLTNDNAQQEYYLTDIIQMAVHEKTSICSYTVANPIEIQGVNNRIQLNQLERAFQAQLATQLMERGVTLMDASRIDIRGTLTCGKDVIIDINTLFIGHVVIENHCIIGPNVVLKDVIIGAKSEILANSVLEGCHIGERCHIGPFARLRPQTILGADCKIGNFVETKNAQLDTQSKASHLSYLGDVTIGKAVNIGAGTITCNYDGVNKHQTIIEDGAFIGSDTQLVAPITVGANATIGAGTTLRKNAPGGELTITESRQKTLSGWQRPKKTNKPTGIK